MNKKSTENLSNEEYLERVMPAMPDGFGSSYREFLMKIVPVVRKRTNTIDEAKGLISGEFRSLYSSEGLELNMTTLLAKESPSAPGSTRMHLQHVLPLISGIMDWSDPKVIKATITAYTDTIPSERGGPDSALWPLRYVLSGQEHSSDPFTLIYILGPTESASRVEEVLGMLGD